jgi:hypothetical protein
MIESLIAAQTPDYLRWMAGDPAAMSSSTFPMHVREVCWKALGMSARDFNRWAVGRTS